MAQKQLIALIALLTFNVATAGTDSANSRTDDWHRSIELLESGDARAIEHMKKAFAEETDPAQRRTIASVLVTLRIDDSRYYEYLAQPVRDVIERDTPSPVSFPVSKPSEKPALSEEFVRWCDAHDLDAQQAAAAAIYDDPGHLLVLGSTGDPRAFDLLRKGLKARNYFVAIQAASGLAEIGDPRAIDPLLDFARRVPGDSKIFIALALMEFGDPRATAEASKLVPAEVLPELQDEVERNRARRRERSALTRKLGLLD